MGNVLNETSLTDMGETFQRSDSLNSADIMNANDCYENVVDEQKISVFSFVLRLVFFIRHEY